LIFVSLPLWLPLLLLTALLLAVSQRGSVFFLQERPGLNGRPYRILKFKTMSDARDANGELLPDSERITRVGRIVRQASLDELPQLINVVKGDMSLVGPRPLLMEYLPLYSDYHRRRHEVLPGITGLAQVSGRNLLSWDERFDLDVQYVDSRSLRVDIRILGATVIKVLRRQGISSASEETMPPYRGPGS